MQQASFPERLSRPGMSQNLPCTASFSLPSLSTRGSRITASPRILLTRKPGERDEVAGKRSDGLQTLIFCLKHGGAGRDREEARGALGAGCRCHSSTR